MNKKTKTLQEAINRDKSSFDINSVQIFTFGPNNMIENNISHEQVKNACKNMRVFIHAPYLNTILWKINKNNMNSAKYFGIIANFHRQMNIAKILGAEGIILHINKVSPEYIAASMKILEPFARKTGVKILLEMIASKADDNLTYETPQKIDRLISAIGKGKYYGIVLDTAHIWANGVNIQTKSAMDNWFSKLKNKDRIMLFHLNGSSAIFGSGKDRHEIPFSKCDLIWGNINYKSSGAYSIVKFAKSRGIPMICEINRGTKKSLLSFINYIKN